MTLLQRYALFTCLEGELFEKIPIDKKGYGSELRSFTQVRDLHPEMDRAIRKGRAVRPYGDLKSRTRDRRQDDQEAGEYQ